MAKPKVKVATLKDQELNRWCIEQALRWPVLHVPATPYAGHALGAQIGGRYLPARDVDADVIGRATKIAAWVKEAR